MKKTVLFVTIALFALNLFAGNVKNITVSNSQNEFKVTKNEETKFVFKTSFSSIQTKEINTKDGLFNQLFIEGYVEEGEIGSPGLPALKNLIEIPYGATARVNFISYDEEIISLNDLGLTSKISPVQPSVRKDQDPSKLPYYFNSAIYNTDDYLESTMAEVQIVGIMRGVRMARLVIRPIQYNPVQNTIRVLKNIVAEVVFDNADISLTQNMKTKYYSPMFQTSLSSLINYKVPSSKDLITTYPVKYLIISDKIFEAQLQPFVEWKTRKGFKVVEAYTDVIGATTTAIKNYIHTQYVNGTVSDPAPTYILLVGDVAQIPAFTGTAISSSSPTDLYYGEMDGGGDVIPDIYYGRFSAQNTGQLQPQIDKTLQYEQYTMPDPSFLRYSVLVAGVDVSNTSPGNSTTYGNGQVNYGASYCNPSNGITSYNYLWGGPLLSNDPSAAPAIHQNVSDGAGFVNYTAHCGSSGWSNPSFNTTDVAALTNQNKYCFMIGNCCQSNMFNVSECFGEAILRAANKGAIGYVGASDYSYWNEDYYFSVGTRSAIVANPTYDASHLGFYDRLFHLNGEAEADWHVSAGQLVHAGNLGVTQSGSSVTYYWEEYHLMGDPSLMPYLGIPTALSPLNYSNSFPLGSTTVTVTTEPYAYVGLSLNNVWVDAKYTGASGIVNLDISTIASPCTLSLVVTKQNRQPHIGTIMMVPNTTPYVVYESNVIHDAGVAVNGLVEYSETNNLDVTLKNVGTLVANNITATLSTTNTNVTITDNTQTYGTIAATSSVTQTNAFAFNVANVIPDQQTAQFTITASDGGSGTWSTNFNVMLNAPVINATTVTVDDAVLGNGNGRLDKGESATIKILTTNTGHAISPLATGTLTLNSGPVTIPANSQNLGAINSSGDVLAAFNVIVDANTTDCPTASFTYDVSASGYTATKTFTFVIDSKVEDFETNTFTKYPWDMTQYGNAPWTIIDTIGSLDYSARSGKIGNGTYSPQVDKTTELLMNVTVLFADTLSFYKKVNTEQDYDFLTFYIDNIQQGQWSGLVDWSREAYYVTAGVHTLKWVYNKDYSTAPVNDRTWIDNIILPCIEMPLGITPNNNSLQFASVYPNPATSESVVSFYLNNKSSVSITLMNSLGQNIKTILSDKQENEGVHTLPLSTEKLSAGMYYCKFNIDNQYKIVKVIVTK